MLKAKKGNRVVRIPDEKKKEYQVLGYTISDMSGKVLYEPTDPKKEIESLKAQLDDMEKEKAELEEKLKEAPKVTKTAGTKKAEAADKAPDAGNKAGDKAKADK